jgi:hypothetical protein
MAQTGEEHARKVWQAQCCVPAFLGAAIAALAPGARSPTDGEIRRQLAVLTGTTLAPEDPNPWGLPTSAEASEWGVSAAEARATFAAVRSFMAADAALSLAIVPLNTIAFELYEDAVIDAAQQGAVVGITFDYAVLRARSGRPEPRRRAHHLVRLTPTTESERLESPNVASGGFAFDYGGSLRVFDDSVELCDDDALVNWRDLIYASRSVEGGLWIVRSTSRDGA